MVWFENVIAILTLIDRWAKMFKRQLCPRRLRRWWGRRRFRSKSNFGSIFTGQRRRFQASAIVRFSTPILRPPSLLEKWFLLGQGESLRTEIHEEWTNSVLHTLA